MIVPRSSEPLRAGASGGTKGATFSHRGRTVATHSPPGRCGTPRAPLSSPPVDTLTELSRLLEASTDDGNPSADELVALLEGVKHIAVVGLSRNLEKPARRVPSYLAAKGFDVIPVNPHADRLLGRRSYATLAEVPPPVDLVLIFRPSREAGRFVEEAMGRSDRPAIWLQTGIRAEPQVRAAREEGRTVVQDLCIFRVHRVLMA